MTYNQVIETPLDSKILRLQIQHEKICILVLVSSDLEMEKRYFSIFETGSLIKNIEELDYIDTFQSLGGLLIYHVFENKNKR